MAHPLTKYAKFTADMKGWRFEPVTMGGNVEAWRRPIHGGYVLLCTDDGGLWGSRAAECWTVARYTDGLDHSEPQAEEEGLTLAAALEASEVWALQASGNNG